LNPAMDLDFDEAWASSVVQQLSGQGVDFAHGLSEHDVESIGAVFGVPIPRELGLFLRAGVPKSPKWARWLDGPDVVFDDARSWIHRAFTFDIQQGQYWHSLLGDKPADIDEAIAQALAVVDAAPPLIPIYAHRFLATEPLSGPRAVLSVWQPIDSIFYGNDLADYFAREFLITRPAWATDDPPSVPAWEDLFDLFCVGR